MDRWEKAYFEHAIHAYLKTVQVQLSAAKTKAEIIGGNSITEVNRTEHVISVIKARLDRADPQLIELGNLNTIHSRLTKLDSHLDAFLSDNNVQHLINANDQIQPALVVVNNLFVVSSVDEEKSTQNAVNSLRQSASINLGLLKKDVEETKGSYVGFSTEVEKKVSDLTMTIESQKLRLDEMINGLQSQFSNEQSNRNTAFGDEIKSVQDRMVAAFEKIENESKALIEAQFGAISSFNLKVEDENKLLLEKQATDFEKVNTATTQQSAIWLNEVETNKDKVHKLVGIVTNTSLAGGYQKVANSEKAAKWFWRISSTLSILVLIGFAFYIFRNGNGSFAGIQKIEAKDNVLAYLRLTEHLGIRIFLAATLGIFASFAAKQANKHESTEHRNRRMELELTAITPYIKDMKPEEQLEIKKEMLDKFFGQEQDLEKLHLAKEHEGTSLALLKDMMKTLKDLVAKIRT